MNLPVISKLEHLFKDLEGDANALKKRIQTYLKDEFNLPDAVDISTDEEKQVVLVRIGSSLFRSIAGKIMPGLLDKINLGSLKNTYLRVLGNGEKGIREIRFEWEIALSEVPRLELPALAISSPQQFFLSLVLQNTPDNGHLPHVGYLIATFDPSQNNRSFKIESNFAWNRDGKQRELQNDDERAGKPPLLSLELKHKTTAAVSVSMLAFDGKDSGLPDFFQLHQTPLTLLQLPAPGQKPNATATSVDFKSFTNDWSADFKLNLDDGFTLPFLKNNKAGNAGKTIQQFLSVKKGAEGIQTNLEESTVKVPLDVEVKFGKLLFGSGIDLMFNWKSFAFHVEHNDGIKLLTKTQTFPFDGFLGLRWRFVGAKVSDSTGFHLFTLVTKDYNYQLQMAPGAQLIIEYTKLSDEPIAFLVSDFTISAKGISLSAEVLNQPTRLRGIDTKFSFEGTKITIVENKIQDFTLTGSGPLPPALVGDAMVDIMLQFSQDEQGDLKLVSGGAKLQKNKLLEAKNTRFQFRIDSIGLKFVLENGYHLFFIMSGSAAFVPNPRDKKDGPLTPLSKIKIEFVDCPLTGDAKVLAKHIKFLVELPKPARFQFLGCFTMEIRSLGFLPSADPFDGDPAMLISGQVMFAIGGQDTKSARADFHGLYIGVPAKGSFLPRISLKELALEIQMGAAFRIAGSVSFVDTEKMSGFTGSGLIEIKGLPTMSANFAFMRVRRDADGQWLRAWFVYLEVGRISLEIPVVHLYLREIGLGFGYRYTLTSIKAAEESKSTDQLIKELRRLSRTQGNLSSQDAWALDLEAPGQDPRWTIVLRAMISQTSVSSPLKYNSTGEKELICTFLFDVVIAFRSDLTFLMAARVWLNTNYNDFLEDVDGIRNHPLLSGFMYIDPRRKRLLAGIATNPEGKVGGHPPFPAFINEAIKASQFSLTLLIEPGLFHYEMGWPNMMRWEANLAGILKVEQRGGFVFRITKDYVLLGVSFVARGALKLQHKIDLGVVGAEVSALASVAYGGRFIAVTPFKNVVGGMMMYGAIGLDLRVEFSVRFWIDLWLFSADVSFSLFIGFTASLEIGLQGLSPGLRGHGTISVGAMGRSIRMTIRIGLNEGVIEAVQAATAKYMNVGLEASDTPADVPGVGARAERDITQPLEIGGSASRAVVAPLHLPGYHAFVIRPDKQGEAIYFLLYPQGEDGAQEERGFLPVPPPMLNATDGTRNAVTSDFRLEWPAGTLSKYRIRHFNPQIQALSEPVMAGNKFDWRVNWNAVKDLPAQQNNAPAERPFRIADLVGSAFIDGEKDPEPLPMPEKMADERVQNPSDDAFEAAVRGAFEQFEGSPYFKKDPNNVYEQNLSAALSPETTVYSSDGMTPQTDSASNTAKANNQTDQLRGMIVSQMIDDFKAYVQGVRAGQTAEDLAKISAQSVAFQLGLVFEALLKPGVSGTEADWLEDVVAAANVLPKISQRLSKDGIEPASETQIVRTFNVRATGFANNSPKFQRVRHFTDANTIAITWDLEWNRPVESSGAQADPEHHLQHYRVLRRALDNGEPDLQYTVKSAAVLHRTHDGSQSILKALQPRFHIVDHFNQESLEEQAALPVGGRSYLYTITPVDFSDQTGRPLSVVATRYPNQPPLVPLESELNIRYTLNKTLLQSMGLDPGAQSRPAAVLPDTAGTNIKVGVRWKEPVPLNNTPHVAIGQYCLIFRRQPTLPVGSYQLDGLLQGPRSKFLPTSNARPLPTDIRIKLDHVTRSGLESSAEIPFSTLQEKGVSPQQSWQPEAWSVFFQTISINGVPSALVPVNLLVGFDGVDHGKASPSFEERRPAQLEWLPVPLQFQLLPPEDLLADTGKAHFPMFKREAGQAYNFHFDPTLGNLGHREHPAGLRAIRFRWNQGPSAVRDYPLALNAGYQLLQLDVDAHTTDTFQDTGKLADALQEIQEMQMAPSEDMLLLPADTLTTSQWEAWYPSAVLRLRADTPSVKGSETPYGPWYSWRDSFLEWPVWPGLTEETDTNPQRPAGPHPLLNAILEEIGGEGLEFQLQVQVSPPVQAETEKDFLRNTAPKNDPYGWGVLQRFGLSLTLAIHKVADGEILQGQTLLEQVQAAIIAIRNNPLTPGAEALPFLFVELLFQQAKSVELNTTNTSDDRLLGLIQLSLRPRVKQLYRYAELAVEGVPDEPLNLSFQLPPGGFLTLVEPAQTAQGEKQLEGAATPVTSAAQIPADGTLRLLLRAKGSLPPAPVLTRKNGTIITALHYTAFEPTDERSTYFTAPPILSADFAEPGHPEVHAQWMRFKRLAEAGNSDQTDAPTIQIPVLKNGLDPFLPDFLNWSLRFMQHGAPVGEMPGTAPWTATAYPRAGTPAYTSPDNHGRLQYDHLLEDPWAHNYRFYIRPYGRYDRLWESLRQSPALFPMTEPPQRQAMPDPEAGGLDVVLHRTQAVVPPVVLSSRRLDVPATPGSPSIPGAIWEVIVAQHPEQSLIERNQTLFRQLAFRQIAFSLMRRFSQDAMLEDLRQTFGIQQFTDIEAIADQYPAIPDKLPAKPAHIDLRLLDSDEQLSLRLPERIGKFSQNAMVLQWDGLPFYYEQKLDLIAQTASTVSRVNSVLQRDFHYQSPTPRAILWTNEDHGVRKGSLFLPLQRLWDALSPLARLQWAAEAPGLPGKSRMRYAGLPDLEVVYQLAELFHGNIEVQTEYFFGNSTPPPDNVRAFQHRQLAKRLIPAPPQALVPTSTGNPLKAFILHLDFDLPLDIPVLKIYDKNTVLLPTQSRFEYVSVEKLIRFSGILTLSDVDNMLWNTVQELIEIRRLIERKPESDYNTAAKRRTFLETWYSTRMVQHAIDITPLPEALRTKLELLEQLIAPERTDFDALISAKMILNPTEIGWKGIVTAAERTALTQFTQRNIRLYQGAQETVAELGGKLDAETDFTKPYDLTHDFLPDAPANFSWTVSKTGSNETRWDLRWQGLAFNQNAVAALQTIRGRLVHPAFQQGIDHLIQAIQGLSDVVTSNDNAEITFLHPPKSPDIPPDIAAKFSITLTADVKWKLQWNGSINDHELNLLDALKTSSDADDAFKQALNQLIVNIKQLTTNFNANNNVQMPLALYLALPESTSAVQQLGGAISLNADTLSLTWRRNQHEVPNQAALFQTLETRDPFLLHALKQIHDDVAAREIHVPLRPVHLLRCKTEMSDNERDALLKITTSEDVDAVNDLYRDLADRAVLLEALASFRSEERVSRAPAAGPLPEGISFADAPDCRLVLTGRDTSTFDGLSGTAVFQDGLEQLKAALQSNPVEAQVQIKSSAVPEALQGFFRPTPGANPVLFKRLVWNAPLTPADAAAMRAWDLGPEVAEAVELLLKRAAAQVTTVTIPLDAGLPQQEDLPGNLLLGKVNILYQGWMLQSEGQQLAAAFTAPADLAAIQRLYAASQRKLLHDRDFRIMCRRGAAAPSSLEIFEVLPLNEPNP